MKTILYATDCTENDASTLRYAYRLSYILKADLHVLHVYDFPPIDFLTIQPKEVLKKRMQDEQKDLVKKYCDMHLKHEFCKNPIAIHATENVSIVNGILDITKGLLPDLIILGMKDNHSTRGYFSGNIAHALLDKIEVPLLIMPNGLSYNSLSTIIYATDFEEEDILSIQKLIEIASPFGALIEVIHVFDSKHQLVKENMDRFKNSLLKQVSYPEITFKTIASNKIKSGLLRVLKKEQATMLAMLERKYNSDFNILSHKDLVKDMGATVSIPLLVFSKHNTKSKKIISPLLKKIKKPLTSKSV